MKLAIMMTGGIDSTTLLYKAKKDGKNVTALYACYGQAVQEIERENVLHHVNKVGCEVEFIYYTYQKPGSPLEQTDFVPVETHDQEEADYYNREEMLYHDTHIEGRNAIMMANVLAWCADNDIDELWTGYKFTALDWKNRRSYKLATSDNGPDFIDAMNVVAKYGYSKAIRIRAPFMELRWDKSDVLKLAALLNIDLKETYSCYYPTPCGKCDNCFLRSNAEKSSKNE